MLAHKAICTAGWTPSEMRAILETFRGDQHARPQIDRIHGAFARHRCDGGSGPDRKPSVYGVGTRVNFAPPPLPSYDQPEIPGYGLCGSRAIGPGIPKSKMTTGCRALGFCLPARATSGRLLTGAGAMASTSSIEVIGVRISDAPQQRATPIPPHPTGNITRRAALGSGGDGVGAGVADDLQRLHRVPYRKAKILEWA